MKTKDNVSNYKGYDNRWRIASYKKAPQATETFKESIDPNKGSFAV